MGSAADHDRDIPLAIVVASIVGACAFAAYSLTLLRGVDLGDTGAFQASMTWPDISARQAYPLYYAVALPFVHLAAPGNPALGLNLFSAVAGAVAVGGLALVATLVTGAPAAGALSALLLAFSYTWWHQAIIAEVYTLHLLLVGICLVALWAYAQRPTTRRLGIFFFVYAIAYGNHLSMVLLLAPFAIFLFLVTDRASRLFRPAIIGMALAIAAAGALQYLPQLLVLKHAVEGPQGLEATLTAFWFDVTKSDWRESMLLGVRENQMRDHLAMALFDAQQQFGIAGLVLALVGVTRLWRRQRPWAALAISVYVINLTFATTYNVGDPHVFFLPGHYITAFCAGAAIMPWGQSSPAGSELSSGVRGRLWPGAVAALSVAAIGYASWRAYDTWPAADRHDDQRAEQFVDQLTYQLDDHNAVLVADLDWQMKNALLYAGEVDHRGVAWVDLHDVLAHFPFFVDTNHALGRDVVATAQAAARIQSSYGPLFPLAPDDAPLSLEGASELIPPGATYVLAVLTQPRNQAIDVPSINGVVAALTGTRMTALHGGTYEVIAGRAGEAPAITRASDRPFRERARIGDASMDVRMDSWLPTETFRRGGFGHVIRDHKHVMALERGVNLVWFGADGDPSRPYYASGLYAPQVRYRIPANAPGLAQVR